MGSMSDKAAGLGNQAAGAAKQAAGKATDNPRLQGEGDAQRVKGKVQETVGDAKSAVKKVVDKA